MCVGPTTDKDSIFSKSHKSQCIRQFELETTIMMNSNRVDKGITNDMIVPNHPRTKLRIFHERKKSTPMHQN